MGDGQHIWAAAEWVLMIRNCFVREEVGKLILFSGIPKAWLESKKEISFGPVLTRFGKIQLSLKPEGGTMKPEWEGEWYGEPPKVEVHLVQDEKGAVR